MNFSENISNLAQKYFKSGEYEVAMNLLLVYLRENESDLDARLLLVQSCENLGKIDIAIEQANAAHKMAALTKRSCSGIEAALDRLEMKQSKSTDRQTSVPNVPAQTKPADYIKAAFGAPGGENHNADPPQQETRKGNSLNRLMSPYFGFPETAYGAGKNNYGFVQSETSGQLDYPSHVDANDFVVGIFGGSFASSLFQSCEQQIAAALAQHPDLRGRRIKVLNFAMGAAKQPVQLFYLNYFLAIGQTIDLVVNIDGINDTVGAVLNFEKGHHPAMPAADTTESFASLMQVPKMEVKTLGTYLKIIRYRGMLNKLAEVKLLNLFAPFLTYLIDKKLRMHQAAVYEIDISEDMMDIARVPALSYLKCNDEQRETIDTQVLQIWSRSTAMMHAVCERFDCGYVHVVPPNPYYLNRPGAGGDEAMMKRASQKIRAISYSIWPKLLDIVREAKIGANCFCVAIDAFDGLQEDVYADPFGHIKPNGEQIIAERLCNHIMNCSFTPSQVAEE